MVVNQNKSEEWKTIDGFPNYEVSNLGNVRSKDRTVLRKGNPTKIKGLMLKPREVNEKTARNPLPLGMGSRAAPGITDSQNSSRES